MTPIVAQHFLLSRAAKSLNLVTVFRMFDEEAEALFHKLRWPETDGAPVCPHCGGLTERILRYLREKQQAGVVEKHGITHDAKWSLIHLLESSQ